MSAEKFYYLSSDGKTEIHAVKWLPKHAVKAVLQISHGMLEHIERYDDFASFMAERGVLVVGNDHLGHGSSVFDEGCRGYFGEDGNEYLIEDMKKLMNIIKDEYTVPYFILGHSMGSFLVRQFITLYGGQLSGAVIVGTGQQPKLLVCSGIAISRMIAAFRGWNYRSAFVDYLAVGSNNNMFKPARTEFDWLTRDAEIVDAYISDKRIRFVFTLNAFYHMFRSILRMNEQEKINSIPKELPLIFLSGEKDPVGNSGKGVYKASDIYRQAGIRNISVKLYKEDRHEILNELDREQIYTEISDWIESILIGK